MPCLCGVCRRCQARRAQARYARTEKGRATLARYNASAKRRASDRRYRASENGQQVVTALNARRIYVGQHYRGRAQTIEHAAVIHAHIKERIRAFITRQPTGA